MPYEPITVARPEWLHQAIVDIRAHLLLVEDGRLPESLHGTFVVTSARRLLRCVYGGDFEAALALREMAEARAREDLEFSLCPVCKGRGQVNSREACPRCFPELEGEDLGTLDGELEEGE